MSIIEFVLSLTAALLIYAILCAIFVVVREGVWRYVESVEARARERIALAERDRADAYGHPLTTIASAMFTARGGRGERNVEAFMDTDSREFLVRALRLNQDHFVVRDYDAEYLRLAGVAVQELPDADVGTVVFRVARKEKP